MKKTIFMSLFVALTCGAASFFLAPQDEATKFTGFTATMVDELFNSKLGKDPNANGYMVAIRPNGDESIIETVGGITYYRVVKTKTRHYWFDPESKAVSTFYQKPRTGQKPSTVAVMPPSDPTCETHNDIAGATLIGHGTFYGFPVVKWQVKTTSRNGDKTVMETWEAPALGCRDIYSDFIVYNADGTFRTETRRMLTDLRIGEPDPALFDPPVGSVEVKPSELLRMFEAARGLSPKATASLNERFDKKYYDSMQYKQ